MPPIAGAQELITYLFEIGPTMAAGMGAGPITFGEIFAWQALTGIRLVPSQVRLLRHLSRTYLNESMRGGVQAPWVAPDEKPQPTKSQLAIRELAKL